MIKKQLIGMLLSGLMLVMLLSGCGPKVYNNGTYIGVSPADDNGYAVAEVTVKDDKIVDVKLTEFNAR
ncbi:MAG: hypothetical protein WBJ77_00995, partial [Bacillota bacterium]